MFEKILVPLDGSELADRILDHLRGVLSASADLTLLGVVPSWQLPLEHPPAKNPLTLAKQHLAARESELEKRGISARSRLEVGDDAAAKIIDFARAHGATLIAMTTHGRTGASRLVRGSVAERVLRHSTVPVLIANPIALAKGEEVRFRKILVPLDGSERAAEVIPSVVELAKKHGSEVLLTYSVPILVSLEPYVASAPIVTAAEGEALLQSFRKRFGDVPVRSVVRFGDPAMNILALAESEKVDLIAMTTHGRTGASRWFFGSVAEQVTRHATCPLLLVRNASVSQPAKSVATATASAAS
jgi:nucleotide-binding universal stress UspA family protein